MTCDTSRLLLLPLHVVRGKVIEFIYISSFSAKSWQNPASIDIQWVASIECQCCRIWQKMTNYRKTQMFYVLPVILSCGGFCPVMHQGSIPWCIGTRYQALYLPQDQPRRDAPPPPPKKFVHYFNSKLNFKSWNLQMKKKHDFNWHTALSVGFPWKNFVFFEFLAGWNAGFRKTHPCNMASNGAGPSYGNPRPTKTWKYNHRLT